MRSNTLSVCDHAQFGVFNTSGLFCILKQGLIKMLAALFNLRIIFDRFLHGFKNGFTIHRPPGFKILSKILNGFYIIISDQIIIVDRFFLRHRKAGYFPDPSITKFTLYFVVGQEYTGLKNATEVCTAVYIPKGMWLKGTGI